MPAEGMDLFHEVLLSTRAGFTLANTSQGFPQKTHTDKAENWHSLFPL